MSPAPSPGQALKESRLPLPLLRRGKVREVYEVDAGPPAAGGERPGERVRRRHARADPAQGRGADADQRFLVRAARRGVPVALRHRPERRHPRAGAVAGRLRAPRSPGGPCWCGGPCRSRSSASCAATSRGPRGREYRDRGTLAGEALPPGLEESARLEPPLFSPATKAESGHDENVTIDRDGRGAGARAGRAAPRGELRASTGPAGTTPPRAGSSSPTPSSSSAPPTTAPSSSSTR